MPSRQTGNSRPARIRRPNPRIGGPLQALLDERFVQHDELAKYLSVHPQNVSRWVRNETGPTYKRLKKIAKFFDVEPGALIDKEAAAELAHDRSVAA